MSLRMKQALILLFATVLPFALGWAAMAFIVAPAYRQAVRSGTEEAARRLAESASRDLTRDVSRLERLAAWMELRKLVRLPPVGVEEAARLDRQWSRLPANSPAVERVLENPVSRELRWLHETDAATAEIMVTNRAGRVVAASAHPADFIQSDEAWWRQAYAEGRGRVFISDLFHDRNADVWAFDIAVPVYGEGAEGSPVIGVLKMTLDVGHAFKDLRTARVGEDGQALLVDAKGQVLVSPDETEPLSRNIDGDAIGRLQQQWEGSMVLGTGEEALLTSWSRVPILDRLDQRTAQVPRLYVVTQRSAAAAFGPLRRVHQWMLLIGLVTITFAVTLGYVLVDRLVVRHIRVLAEGMRELSQGNFEKAAAIADDLLGYSEPEPPKPQPRERAPV